jgi:hypothetical protein
LTRLVSYGYLWLAAACVCLRRVVDGGADETPKTTPTQKNNKNDANHESTQRT